METMKHLAAFAAFATFAAVAQAQGVVSKRAAPDLRSALKQVHSGGSQVPAPRQLSTEERAELRRQISQHGRSAKSH